MKYPGSRAETLRDIDLTIQDGEFVFLVGPSGSGKTTIIKLLTGEIRATGGQIEVNGFDLRTMKRRNLPKLRRSLGVRGVGSPPSTSGQTGISSNRSARAQTASFFFDLPS